MGPEEALRRGPVEPARRSKEWAGESKNEVVDQGKPSKRTINEVELSKGGKRWLLQ